MKFREFETGKIMEYDFFGDNGKQISGNLQPFVTFEGLWIPTTVYNMGSLLDKDELEVIQGHYLIHRDILRAVYDLVINNPIPKIPYGEKGYDKYYDEITVNWIDNGKTFEDHKDHDHIYYPYVPDQSTLKEVK